MVQIEVWMQTFAPGSGTPIHRHECEEVFIVTKGSGTLRLAQSPSDGETPGDVQAYAFHKNDTFVVPVDAVHQITNTDNEEDLQLLVIISRPPIKIFVYPSWDSPHAESQMIYPYTWDRYCPPVQGRKGDEKLVRSRDHGLDEDDRDEVAVKSSSLTSQDIGANKHTVSEKMGMTRGKSSNVYHTEL
ncbi:hypothetical protein CBR_g38020 [Chara braunii]|uniref:Uncharacterized protein n=1 Tax=Chara braunii TaxID=69332 RepID=A0A388K041_CHABU|nr:hypothetical protein CBR_g38020 [Chara braunii]|eukprot:GBG63397.1 hypothetical protein CBR_g38020 [Chara braunii]